MIAIELKGQFPKGTEPRELCKTVHAFFGQLIFLAMILRLILRKTFGTPSLTNPKSSFVTAAKVMHFTFYALLLTLPILGLIFLQAGGKEVHFLGWTWPQFISPNQETKKNVEEIHEFLGNSLYFLIAIHAAAGLWQHYVVKDDALRRMLNKIKPST
jgi:superoxide oxidase